MKKIIIAIDGYSACGKSTLAKQLAEKLHYLFLDTGAMYRAVTLYLLENKINWKEEASVTSALQNINISFFYNEKNHQYITMLNGIDVEEKIRTLEVSNIVSEVSAVSSVRKFLVAQQQAIGAKKGIVMDGRDIGTVVFPQAELKIFVIAALEVRIERRLKEMTNAGKFVTKEEIALNLQKRDIEETTRPDSPLVQAFDAIKLDTTYLTQDEQLQIVLTLAMEKIHEMGG
ncbi:MAG: (d)CMP kinase [Chitinophagales bacterium]